VYIREEYPTAQRRIQAAVDQAKKAGLLGGDVAGSGVAFDIEIRRGGGAYVCGEETALFNSIEGFRGEPRQKPPFPAQEGLFAKPTLVNNVETLVNVPRILLDGAEAFAGVGSADSTGTKLFSVSGDIVRPGVYEVPFGATLRALIDLGGGCSGDLGAVLVGGAAGAFVSADDLDLELTFEGTRAAGLALGSGSIVVFNTDTDFSWTLRRIARFFADESCGQCVPCRVGTVRQVEALDRLLASGDAAELRILEDLEAVMVDASICGLGQFAATAVQSALSLGLIGEGGS
jgi:NADH-quinone oxidoreductase subunit F